MVKLGNKKLVTAGTLLAAAAASLVAAPAMAASDGKALFVEKHKCVQCHGVPAAGLEATTKMDAMKGADLGGKVEVELPKLAAFLRKETENDKGKSHKKPFKGTDEELQAIVDWLGSLEAQK